MLSLSLINECLLLLNLDFSPELVGKCDGEETKLIKDIQGRMKTDVTALFCVSRMLHSFIPLYLFFLGPQWNFGSLSVT